MSFNATPSDSRYVPLTQQKYCCVPTCIQMVMYASGLRLVPAEELGHHLGLTVPEEDVSLFWQVRTGERPPAPAGWGTQIYRGRDEFSLNKAFRSLDIPLKANLDLIDGFASADQAEAYLREAQDRDWHVLVCFDYQSLYHTGSPGGHVSVFDRIDGRQVRLVDPERNVPKWRVVDIDALFKAMKEHGPDNSGGFWVFRRTS